MAERRRTAVLISGRGSNLAALIAASSAEDYPAEIALVLADNPDAAGFAHARKANIATSTVDRRSFPSKAEFEARLDNALQRARIELICLAGFMRLLSPSFVEAWRDKIINIHPSLLPLFPGLDTHARALAAGVRIHGATVHFVRAEMDSGPIIGQGAIPVLAGDTPARLADRVLKVEHRIYPLALALVASSRARVVGDRVEIDDGRYTADAALLSPGD
jgi:phosphoribosylglycinamide formyltransferase 1